MKIGDRLVQWITTVDWQFARKPPLSIISLVGFLGWGMAGDWTVNTVTEEFSSNTKQNLRDLYLNQCARCRQDADDGAPQLVQAPNAVLMYPTPLRQRVATRGCERHILMQEPYVKISTRI